MPEYTPELSMEGFELAFKLGARHIEIDTMLTGEALAEDDPPIVICHDETLDRYGHPSVQVEATPAQELLEKDMGSFFHRDFEDSRMLKLHQLFERFGDQVTYHIEIKGLSPRLPAVISQRLLDYDLAESAIVTCYRTGDLLLMKHHNRFEPRLKDLRYNLLLTTDIGPHSIRTAREHSLYQIGPYARFVTPQGVETAHRSGFDVRAWGVRGTPAEFQQLAERVINAGCNGATVDYWDLIRPAKLSDLH
jgi:glycerophosphoryl diester phosphodiesterase